MTWWEIIIAFFWFLRIVANLAAYLHLWWVKEYRWDRMLIHLRTEQGKRILIIPWRIPHLSPKSTVLLIVSLLGLIVIYYLLPGLLIFRLFILDILTFPLLGLLVWLMSVPTFIYHQWLIRRAIQKLKQHKPMLVIGITGSFGKTSTKEFLATILASQFKVLKTQDSKNSPIGIAEVILTQLKDEHDCFVVEMGAYKCGEIARMTAMVQPQIGVITAINPQHQDLFGTIATTMQAKYELMTGLVGKQIGIFNADNNYVRQMAVWAKQEKKTVWWFSRGLAEIPAGEVIFLAKNISSNLSRGINFDLSFGKLSQKVTAPVIGVHQASNLTAAVAAAVAAGMSFTKAVAAATRVSPIKKTLEPVAGINQSIFINDTFNNNPDAARAALDVLATAGRGSKILVFQPMIELGKFAQNSHYDLGRYAAQICDQIILTNRNFYSAFAAGVQQATRRPQVQVLAPGPVAKYLRQLVGPGDTVLFKGKEAEIVLLKLID